MSWGSEKFWVVLPNRTGRRPGKCPIAIIVKKYGDLSSRVKQVRRLGLLLIVAACGVRIGSQLKKLLVFLDW